MGKLIVLKEKDPAPLEIATSLARNGRKVAVSMMLNGTYLAAETGEHSDAMRRCVTSGVEVYVLEKDAERRGLADRLIEGIKMVDYAGLVDLFFSEEVTVINL